MVKCFIKGKTMNQNVSDVLQDKVFFNFCQPWHWWKVCISASTGDQVCVSTGDGYVLVPVLVTRFVIVLAKRFVSLPVLATSFV